MPRMFNLLWLLLFGLLLAACGGSPKREDSAEKTTNNVRSVQKRGGAYYKDDGPGENIPENLDEIPDAQPRLEPLHRFANRPYVVLGKAYTPETSLKPIKQRGIGSWYGKKFHGQKTSIGETYNMFAMTAAHPSLALPSYVRVTNPNNGKQVVVRVTDRGPFHADRIIDLSYAAAYRLGYIDNGSALVEVEAIIPGEPTPFASLTQAPSNLAPPDAIENLAASLASQASATENNPALIDTALATRTSPIVTPPQKGLFLQLGAFSSLDNAENLRVHLSRELDWLSEAIQINKVASMYRVRLGPYSSRTDAEKVAEKIQQALGYKPGFVQN